MTFSVLAADGTHWGVAIATARSAVGGRCALVGGFGAIATQGMVSTRLGHDVAQQLARGKNPEQAIADSLAGDELADVRQVLAMTPDGAAACWSGAALPTWAGDLARPGVVAAGNTLSGEDVVAAIIEAFHETSGPLSERLLAALAAGQDAGGDRRGRQSACLLVSDGDPWPALDLRVDDHPEPIVELRRIFDLWQGEWAPYDATGAFPPANPPGR